MTISQTMKFADLHVHTFYSDSTFSPEEVVSCAKDKELSAIAICDHDCVDGIAPCEEIAKRYDIEVIPGLELTAESKEAEIHILGYFIDTKIGWFTQKLQEIRAARVGRMHEMVRRLKIAGLKIEASDVFGIAGKGSIGRLHLAKAMLNTGNIRSLSEAFDKYIGLSKPCYVPSMKISPEEAISMILKAGGVPVLAHPNIMGHDEYIGEFVRYGLRGIEAYHIEHKASVAKRYEEMAKDYGLLVTGGSDCHGLGKGRILMGEVRVPYELVEKLKEEARKIKAGI